jgi:hypothetical protein
MSQRRWSLAGWITMGHLLTTNVLMELVNWFPDGPGHYLTCSLLVLLEIPLMFVIPLFFWALQHSDYGRILFDLIPISLVLAGFFVLMFANSILCGHAIAWFMRRLRRARGSVVPAPAR